MASGRPSFLWSLRVGEIVAFYGRLYGLSGAALRRRVERSGSLFPDRSRAALRSLLGVALAGVAVALAGKFLDVDAGSLFSRAAAGAMESRAARSVARTSGLPWRTLRD